MSRTAALVAHSLRRLAPMVLGLALLLCGFEFLLTQVGAYLLRHSAFSQLSMLMPNVFRSLLGPSPLAFMSFAGIVGFGYFHPMVIAASLGITIAIATEPAGEVETRFVDLTLARELTRLNAIARTAVVFVAATVVVLGLMLIGTWTGLACCTPADAPRPQMRVIVSLAVMLGSMMVCWAGIALAIGVASRRRAVAGTIVGVVALAAYLLDYVARVWDPVRAIGRVTPFYFFDPMGLIMGERLNLFNVSVLGAIGVVGFAIGAVIFSRRDL